MAPDIKKSTEPLDERRVILLDSKKSLCTPKRILQDTVPRRNDKQESYGKCGDGTKALSKKDMKIGKTKSATSKRIVPLNKTAIEMIIKLREERYFGENSPLVCDENGGYTKPYSFRNRCNRMRN